MEATQRAHSSYLWCVDSTASYLPVPEPLSDGNLPPFPGRDGLMVWKWDGYNTANRRKYYTTFASAVDGLSNTFMAGEADFGLENYLVNGVLAGGAVAWSSGHWGASSGTFEGVYNAAMVNSGNAEVFTFRSDHPEGCNFLMGDGSIQWVPTQTSQPILRALATRSGGMIEIDVVLPLHD